MLRPRLFSIFISALQFTYRKLLKTLLDCITCSPVDTRYCRLRFQTDLTHVSPVLPTQRYEDHTRHNIHCSRVDPRSNFLTDEITFFKIPRSQSSAFLQLDLLWTLYSPWTRSFVSISKTSERLNTLAIIRKTVIATTSLSTAPQSVINPTTQDNVYPQQPLLWLLPAPPQYLSQHTLPQDCLQPNTLLTLCLNNQLFQHLHHIASNAIPKCLWFLLSQLVTSE